MVASAEYDPIIVDATLSPERARELIHRRRESTKLDYKQSYSGTTRDKVEVTKDLVAMANTAGGYIVFGVNDAGERTGLDEAALPALDEARLRAQVQSYLSAGLDLFVDSSIVLEDRHFAIVTVLRSARSPLVFSSLGTYANEENGGKQTTVFRPGDVFVRRGSASQRWDQEDVQAIYARVVERERERWLAEVLPDIQRLIGMASPAPASSRAPREILLEPEDVFERSVRSMLRSSR